MTTPARQIPWEGEVPEEPGNKFSDFLTTPVIKVTVAESKIFYLHKDLLKVESDEYYNTLKGAFRESKDNAIEVKDEDPALFGYFVEYLYRDLSILSRQVQHYSEYVTLARLYAMGERLQAPQFRASTLWKFGESLSSGTSISDESTCELLRIACTEITERAQEDPMRMQIFWYAGTKISNLQQSGMFRQSLQDVPDLGRQLCLWVGKPQPKKPTKPNGLQYQRFAPESE